MKYADVLRDALEMIEQEEEQKMEAVTFVLGLIVAFISGFGFGYKEGFEEMKRIDDNIIEEAKRTIYGEE